MKKRQQKTASNTGRNRLNVYGSMNTETFEITILIQVKWV